MSVVGSATCVRTEDRGNEEKLTSVDILIDKLWHGALGRISSGLTCELAADVPRAALVKGSLERVTLPTEEIVSVLGVSSSTKSKRHELVAVRIEWCAERLHSRVASRVDEGLAAIFGPDVRVIEGRRVPHDFVHQLR